MFNQLSPQESVRFIHFADLHLDSPFRDDGKTGYSMQRRKDQRLALENIINLSRTSGAHFMLISGDLYEHAHASRNTVSWLCSRLGSLDIPVIIIPGNHDPYVLNSWYRTWRWPDNVIILNEDNPYTVIENSKVFIYGIGFSSQRQEKPDLKRVEKPREGFFNILMLHGTLDLDVAHIPYNPLTSRELSELGYDYYALGHFHNRKRDYELKNAANPGSPEPLGFDEKGEHGVFLVELGISRTGEKSLDIKECDLASRRYIEKDLDITSSKSEEEIKMKLLALIEELDPHGDLLKIRIKGRTNLIIDISELYGIIQDEWLYFSMTDETRSQYDYDILSKEPTLRGAFVRKMLERISDCEKNSDSKNYSILSKALELGLEALENGRIDSLKDN